MITALIIAGVAALVGAMIAVAVVLLNWEKISAWFQKLKQKNQIGLTTAEKDAIGFTLTKAINDPKTPIVQGIFNKKTNEVMDGAMKLEAKSVDEEIAAKHRGHEVVLYN